MLINNLNISYVNSIMSYDSRVVIKINHLIRNNGMVEKKWNRYGLSKYRRWLNERVDLPDLDLKTNYYTEEGNRLPQVSTAKKWQSKNRAKIMLIKEFMKKLEGHDISLDNLSSFIAIALVFYQKERVNIKVEQCEKVIERCVEKKEESEDVFILPDLDLDNWEDYD